MPRTSARKKKGLCDTDRYLQPLLEMKRAQLSDRR